MVRRETTRARTDAAHCYAPPHETSQVHEIKEELDKDGDGLISPLEFEEQARVVEKYCGQNG